MNENSPLKSWYAAQAGDARKSVRETGQLPAPDDRPAPDLPTTDQVHRSWLTGQPVLNKLGGPEFPRVTSQTSVTGRR